MEKEPEPALEPKTSSARRELTHPALQTLGHRPWPLPTHEWRWRQSWEDLAFIHYRVEAGKLAALLPAGVRLQEFDGTAWVGLVPFRLAGVGRRMLPGVPLFASFPELNLRTYVECEGKPGVWFFSLDAASWPVVFGGRHLYDLPYFSARMQQTWRDDGCFFSSVRRGGGARFSARYRPVGEMFFAKRGTFEHWAAERYCLYSFSPRSGLVRVEVHHAPWPLQKADVTIDECSVLALAGIAPLEDKPVCHFSTGVSVVSFAKEKLSASTWASASVTPQAVALVASAVRVTGAAAQLSHESPHGILSAGAFAAG